MGVLDEARQVVDPTQSASSMGIVSSITGALDHASGSVDESVGRQFDDSPGGGTVDFGGRERTNPSVSDEQGQNYFLDHNLGNTDEWVSRLPGGDVVDRWKDASGSGHQDDSVDLIGPEFNPGGLIAGNGENVFVWNNGNPTDDPTDTPPIRWLFNNLHIVVFALVGLYALSAAGPALQLAANATDGE